MEKIICPLEQYKDQEMPLFKVFDTLSINRETARIVGKITQWIVLNEGSRAADIIHRILKANLGIDDYQLYIDMYINTFDKKTLKVQRWHVVDESIINRIFDIFQMIFSLAPALSEVVVYYNRQ